MAIRNVDDLYNELSSNESFSSLFTSPEEFANTMQAMSPDRREAFASKYGLEGQISAVDFDKAVKKKDDSLSNLQLDGDNKGKKANTPQPKPTVSSPLQPAGDTQDPVVPQTPRITLIPNQPPLGSPLKPKTLEEAFPQTEEEKKRQKQGEAIRTVMEEQKKNKDIYTPKKKPTEEQVKQSVEQQRQFEREQRTVSDIPVIQKIDYEAIAQGKEFKKKSDEIARAKKQEQLFTAKESDNSLFKGIEKGMYEYTLPDGQKFQLDEYAIGRALFENEPIEIFSKSGKKVDIINPNKDIFTGESNFNVIDDRSVRDHLSSLGLSEEQADEEVLRLKQIYLQQGAKASSKNLYNQLLTKWNGNEALANQNFLNYWNNRGLDLLEGSEKEAYHIVKQMEALRTKLVQEQKKGGVSTYNQSTIESYRKQLDDFQDQLSELRDNPNNLYDWRTGEFIDTRIKKGDERVAQIQQENKEFQAKYGDKPKDVLVKRRDELLAQRAFIMGKMKEFNLDIPEEGTWSAAVRALQISAANTAGTGTIMLPDGRTVSADMYKRKMDDYNSQLYSVMSELYGLNRAVMLNENVALRKESESVLGSILKNVGIAAESIGREFTPGATTEDANSEYNIRNSLLNSLEESGYIVDPSLRSAASSSVAETITGSAGMLINSMLQIAIGNIAVPEVMALRWAKGFKDILTNKYGKIGGAVFEQTANAMRSGLIFEASGQGFSTGVGESGAQAAFDALNLDKLLGSKGRLAEFMYRTLIGGAGETFEEVAGQYIQGLTDAGFDPNKAFRDSFGAAPESRLDQVLVIGITSLGFSGASNLKILTATRSTLNEILDNPKMAAAYGEVLTPEKKQQIEEVLKAVDDKLADKQSRETNAGVTANESSEYTPRVNAEETQKKVAAINEERAKALQELEVEGGPQGEEQQAEKEQKAAEINAYYDEQVRNIAPPETKFDTFTGTNQNAILGNADLASEQTQNFLASLPNARARRNAATLIAVANNANTTLASVLPNAKVVLHSRESFRDKMSQVGEQADRKGNFSIIQNPDGTTEIEIQINVEDGSITDIAHEVTHGVLFSKFYGDDKRLAEIAEVRANTALTPEQVNTQIEEINNKYETQFSDTLGTFKQQLEQLVNERGNKYLNQFITSYGENAKAEEYLVELTAILAESGELIRQEDPTFFERLLALINKLVGSIGKEAGIKLQKFEDTQEIIDFFNTVASSIRKGEAITETKTPKTDAVQEQTAGQVPVQPETTTSQEVGQREPQAEPQGVTQEGQKEVRSKSQVVYHAGTLKGEGNIYVTPDKKQADAYGRESRTQVMELNVDPTQLASEDYVKNKIKELGYTSPGGTIDELMIPMLMDQRYDESALKPEEIENVKNILKEEGYSGISFMDEDMLQKNKDGIENYFIFDAKDLKPAPSQTQGVRSKARRDPKELRKELDKKLASGEIDDVTLSFLEEYAEQIEGGTAIFERFSSSEQRGIIEGGRTLAEAVVLLGRDVKADETQDERNERQEQEIEDYARERGIWVENTLKTFNGLYGERLGSGQEAIVWRKDDNTVIKSSNTLQYEDLQLFLDRLVLHNTLFPASAQKLVGFGTDKNGDFEVIIEQPFIPEAEEATPEEIKDYLTKLGFEQYLGFGGGERYKTSEVLLNDAAPRNFVKTEDGNIIPIDLILKINLAQYGFGGTRVSTGAQIVEGTEETEEIDTQEATEKTGQRILADAEGELFEPGNLNVSGIGREFPASDRIVNKARIERDENGKYSADGIPLATPQYVSPQITRGKKYNATMSDHTKVGSYVNPNTGVTVDNLFGGLVYSYIAENFNAGVVWASTTIDKARALVENSKGQDMTLIYRMNRATGSNGNFNFANAAWKELTAPIKAGRITESQLLSLLNQRFNSITDLQGILKTNKLKKFESLEQIEEIIYDLPFATRGKLWPALLNVGDTKPAGNYALKLESMGVATLNDIVNNLAEEISDGAADSDVVGALIVDEPDYVEIVDKGKTKLVPKVYTTFPELVNEAQGVFFTEGVQHKSYPYVVKGKPIGIFEEFNQVTDYFPIIEEWMSRTPKSEGYLTKQEFLEKNKEKIQQTEDLYEEAKNRYDAIKNSIGKEERNKLKKEVEDLGKAVKQAKRFTPRLTSPYKAIETMHRELMDNFDSTKILSVTERKPVTLDITNKARVEPWSTPQQEISSAGTSINKAKLPSVYSDKKFFDLLKAVPGKRIVIADIGSGKYANVNIKPLLEKGEIAEFINDSSKKMLGEKALPALEEILGGKEISYFPYDPFNQPALVNEETINTVRDGGADIAVSPNVLNVIAEAEAREGVIANMANAVGTTGTAVIQIYEGEPKDRGVGKETKTAGETSWQNNQKTEWYMPEVQAYFANVKRSGNIIIADNKGQLSLFGVPAKVDGAQKVQIRNKARIEDRVATSKKYGVPQRYKNDVGKMIGGELYVHYSANDVLPQQDLIAAEGMLPEGFEYEVIKYNAKDGSFSFISSPDWNTSDEPIVGDAYKVKKNGEVTVTKQKADPQIYHHKWNFVRDDYSGFDVEKSVQRSIDWYRDAKADINMFKIGTQSYWQENAVPLITDTTKIINKGRVDRVDFAIVKDYEDFRNNGFSVEGAYFELEKMNYSPGDIKRYVPEIAEVWRKRTVNKFFATIRRNQGKLLKRQQKIREELQRNPGLEFDTLYGLLKDRFEDFELFKAFYEEGADPKLLDEIFGTEYRQTIQKAMDETRDGRKVYNKDILRELRDDARSRKMINMANQMNNIFGFFNGIMNNEEMINMLVIGLEGAGFEFAFKKVTDDMRSKREELQNNLNIFKKISRGEIEPDQIADVAQVLSLAGRLLRMGRGLFQNEQSLEDAIVKYLESATWRSEGDGIIRKFKAFKVTDNQRKKIRAAVSEFRQAKAEYDKEIKLLEESEDAYTDAQFEAFDKAKIKFEQSARKLKVTIDAFRKKSTGNWFTSMTAQALLSFRTIFIGAIGNLEMMLASSPKKGKLLIFGWSRALANKLVTSFTSKSVTDLNAMIKRGAYGNIDPTLYRKMAWEQGVQQIKNIFQNTIASVSTNEDSFFETQTTIDSMKELPTGFKMVGMLLKNIFKKDFDKMSDQEWADAFDQLLVLMNEKDENGNNKLALMNPKGYQAAATLMRGIFGYIPTVVGKSIAISGDRVFYQYGYYEALASYANSQGITDPAEVKKFIRLNSVPNAVAGDVAKREGERRIFANDNAVTDWFANVRGNIAKAEKELYNKSVKLKREGKYLQRFTRIYPQKLGLATKKMGLTVLSPFTRIPSNFVATAVEKTVFPYTLVRYMLEQKKLNRLVKEYDELFNVDRAATLSATKQKEQERMRAAIFEQQRNASRFLTSTFQATQVALVAYLLLQSGVVGAPYGDDEEEKKAARAAGIAGQPPGKINVSAFFDYIFSGFDSKGRVYEEGDITFQYTNLGLIGFALSWFSTLQGSLAAKEFEDRKVMGVGEDGYSNVTFNMIAESITNGITGLSFIQNIASLVSATKTGAEGVQNFGVNLAKTALTVPTAAYGLFGAVERAEGISADNMRNYYPDLEADEEIGSKFKMKLWTSLTGKSPIFLFGLKNSKGEFLSPYASPYYQPQIGPHGEELYKKNTFWDVRSGELSDRVAAYLQASFDPFAFSDYEGFVSSVKKYDKKESYKKGDIVDIGEYVIAVKKNIPAGADLSKLNLDQQDKDYETITESKDFFDKDKYMLNKRGSEATTQLYDIMALYQKATGSRKEFGVLNKYYDPFVQGKDDEGEFGVYIPLKYQRQLAKLRGDKILLSYDQNNVKETIERIQRNADEMSDQEFKEYVESQVEDLLMGPVDPVSLERKDGILTKIGGALKELEDDETYRVIKKNAIHEALAAGLFTEEEYDRMANAEGTMEIVAEFPESKLKFRK